MASVHPGYSAAVPPSRSRFAALIVGLVLLVPVPGPRPYPLPAGADPSLGEVSPAQRLGFLRQQLGDEARRTSVWTIAWIAANGVLLAGTAGMIPFYAKESRVDLYVGLGATTIAALPLVLLPPGIERDGAEFARLAGQAPPDSCALIASGEELLARYGAEQSGYMQWSQHLMNAAYNIAVGLVLGLAFNRWQTGGTAMLSGFTIGEVVMFTQPRTLPGEWTDYLAGRFSGGSGGGSLSLLPAANGLTLRLTF